MYCLNIAAILIDSELTTLLANGYRNASLVCCICTTHIPARMRNGLNQNKKPPAIFFSSLKKMDPSCLLCVRERRRKISCCRQKQFQGNTGTFFDRYNRRMSG
jgi:hypothetical protein